MSKADLLCRDCVFCAKGKDFEGKCAKLGARVTTYHDTVHPQCPGGKRMHPVKTERGTAMNTNEVIIPCRLSYANLWEPKQVNGTGDPKYSCCLLIKKSDTNALAAIRKAIEAIKTDPASLAKWGGKLPPKLKEPLRDGDEEKDDENYEGCYFLNANANADRRPRIIDRACNEVLDQDEVYSGCYAKVKVGFFSYSASGNRGIGAGLEVIQKIRDGERLSGGNNLDGFEVLSDDDDSFLD